MFLAFDPNTANATNKPSPTIPSNRGRGGKRGRGSRLGRTTRVHRSPSPSSSTDSDHSIPDKKMTKKEINQDAVLFQIWFLINGWNKTLLQQFEKKSIKTIKHLQNISLYDLFQFISSIDWTKYDANIQKNVLDKIEEIRKQPPSNFHATSIHDRRQIYRPRTARRGDRGMRRGRGRGRGRSRGGGPPRQPTNPRSTRSPAISQNSPKIGFAVGGANDINSFRDNIMSNKIPQINSITFEGIYYDYYFNTEENETGTDAMDEDEKTSNELEELPLFYPSYCYAKSFIPDAILMANSKHVTKRSNIKRDMIEDDDDVMDIYDVYDFHINKSIKYDDNAEYFLTVGLNSNIKQEDFARPHLNLVVVLDISGSMSIPFDRETSRGGSKMKTANQCILSLVTNLQSDDRFGLVLFDHTSSVGMNFKKIKEHYFKSFEAILNITARGGTNFELGYKSGLNMFNDNCDSKEDDKYENRIIFLTDACPNCGTTDPDSLMNMVKTAALNKDVNKRIYTTFVGVGLDFNADLISEISRVRGANYFAVHSSADFLKKIHLEFDYIVSPMVFDLKLSLQSEGNDDNSCIEAVYGSNDIDVKSGEIMNINTLFPSPPNDDGEIKGGIVLIKLKKCVKQKMDNVMIECSFEDKYGVKHKNKQHVVLKKDRINEEYYANLGIRKGILLTRYVILMKQWIENTGGGILLKVNGKYKQMFKHFMRYFKNEINLLKDKELEQEIKLLEKLMKV